MQPLLAGLFATAVLAGPAAGAERMFQSLPAPSAACGTPLPATGKAVALNEPLDETTRTGLMAGVHLTLRGPAENGWPEADLKAAEACPIARFAAKDLVWTIHSGAGAAPLRVIVNDGREDAFLLVKGPSIADAAAWNRARQGPAPAASAYYLVAKLERMHYLVKLYDGPPAMEAVADDIGALMEDRAATLAFYEGNGGTVNLNLRTNIGPQAELFVPENLKEGRFAGLYRPDGRFVTENEHGDFVLRGSGFRCRKTYGKARRERVTVTDPSDASLDLACAIGEHTLVYVTRVRDAAGDKAAFAKAIRSLESDTGVARKLVNPPTSSKGPILAGRNWLDKEGQVQLVLFLRDGEYVYEIRQSHAPDEIEAAGETMLALVEQIAGPEPESAAGWRRR